MAEIFVTGCLYVIGFYGPLRFVKLDPSLALAIALRLAVG